MGHKLINMKKLIIPFFILFSVALTAQEDSLKIEWRLFNGSTTSSLRLLQSPFYYTMQSPFGLPLKIDMSNGDILLGDKKIGTDPDLITWAKGFFEWIKCADFNRCYFTIKP